MNVGRVDAGLQRVDKDLLGQDALPGNPVEVGKGHARRRVLWCQFDGALEGCLRIRLRALKQLNAAESGEGDGSIGIDGDGLLDFVDSAVDVAETSHRRPAYEQRINALG